MTRKRIILYSLLTVVVLATAFWAWSRYASRTKIAFVNYQAITLGQIARACDNSSIEISELPVEELDRAGDYDMLFLNGMGLRITEEQRAQLVKAAEQGLPVLSTAVTNPQNYIVSVDSIDAEYMKQYLVGGRSNYRNLLSYVRRFIDGKKLFAPLPGDPVVHSSSLLYYPQPEVDELSFNSVAEYEAFLRREGKWKPDAQRIILTGSMGVPDSLITAFEREGKMIYPVGEIQRLIAGSHADTIQPSAMINMAHGRMGDAVTTYLKENNIPLFAPLNVNTDYDEWMADNKGMTGGFLSQSVVTPEIDGALLPYTLFAHFTGNDGLPYVDVVPDRLQSFVATVDNYLALRRMDNAEKKVAIFYFKGPGQSALVAEGMEVVPSLFNLLTRMKREGYKVENLPSDAASLQALIDERGRIFNGYAQGARRDFVNKAKPQLISKTDYEAWSKMALPKEMSEAIDSIDGGFPGHGLSDEKGNLALARIELGNVVLIPQPAAGLGSDDFKIVHGTDAAPPHAYAAAYLWARYGFSADALVHFGAHGSLEFTPRKQVALSSRDWSDRLIGTLPHFYVYSTSNPGEAMIAKRRSYAGIVNYLTPPFMESGLRNTYKELTDAVAAYEKLAAGSPSEKALAAASLRVKALTLKMGIHRELRLDSIASRPYSAEEIARISNFAEELANERVTGALYVMGVPYSGEHINSTVMAMTVDPLAYSLAKLHKAKDVRPFREQASGLVRQLSAGTLKSDDALICRLAGITPGELAKARATLAAIDESKNLFSKMMVMGSSAQSASQKTLKISDRPETRKAHKMLPGLSPEKALAMAKKMGADPAALKKMEAAIKGKSVTPGMKGKKGEAGMPGMKSVEVPAAEMEKALAIAELERSLSNVSTYREALLASPEAELSSLMNALSGGYITPTPGGDPVLNPAILPTGRNMYAVDAETTPSPAAWEKGKELAENTIAMYRKAHGDSIPRKVSYTLWSSEFIETDGATIAQVLYMLGVEPVRDPFGRVTDLRLIPQKELGRPRIDVVVQTSGQLRDLAASRLFLISRAVKMAAEAEDKEAPNYVREGVVESERYLVDKGLSPKEAREVASSRVFGGVNGNYGSGIQEMVEAGDRWDNSADIARTYMANMGASYGSEQDWEQVREYAFEAALTRTDVVVQPRQSNTWGALSLDHVYEFMGGMNLSVKEVTGKDPDAYLSDYRNRSHARMQEVKEAIGVESRTTILNPAYIKEKMKGGAGDASAIAEVITNTYGWNVMKPDVIDNELWNDIYDTYVADKHSLGTKEFFSRTSPAALQEMTAVMLETARKGMWKASDAQLRELAKLHAEMIEKHGAACTGFVCDNAKLRDYIAGKLDKGTASAYSGAVAKARGEKINADKGTVMKKEEVSNADRSTTYINGVIVAGVVLLCLVGIIILIRRRRKTLRK